ncbi:MAG: nucleotidyltransferase domain-containing protein [Chloroflexota bacterium]
MGTRAVDIKNTEHLKDLLQGAPVRVEQAFLFGSRATGHALEWSDWDILMVSPDFAGVPFPDRASVLLRALPLKRAELFCYTPDEFRQGLDEIGLISEAVKGTRLI